MLFGDRPFFLYFCAIFASAIFCGFGPSLITILLSSGLVMRFGAFRSVSQALAQTIIFAALGVALTAALSKRREEELRDERATSESMRMLNEVSDVLSSSLDYEETIPAAVRLAVTHLGDWCEVTFVDDEGRTRQLAVVHRDPKKEVTAKSTLVAPMVARGRTIGALTFAAAERDRYNDEDARLAELIARRAAIAIDNAQLYRAAVEASNAKDEFLATVSHELRTPMTATLGWVRMLNLGHFDPETHKTALDAIERSTRAQAKLIEDILDVSSIVLGKFRLDREPVDLRAVVDASIETLRPAIEAKQITLNVDSSRWNGVVQGDADRLQQVIWNLVSNAIKFGHRHGHIDVTVERTDDHARITVRDDGAGIDPAFLPFVFDRFRQADGSATRSHGGLGLGLAIVRHLTELHGGSVRATSEGAGKGSSFIVELPATIGAVPGEAGESMLSFHPPT
jgi:signal transduction histidine kinase